MLRRMSDFDLNALMQQAQAMQQQMAEMQKNLETVEVTGAAGGGMVKVRATAAQKILGIEIDPAVMGEDKDMLQDLITAAVNSALDTAKEAAASKASSLLPPGMTPPPGFPGLG